jgi:phospholipid/cholesterol/gamma-HCH transport system substrate-binding protein
VKRLLVALAGLLVAAVAQACGGGGTMTLTATFDDVGDLVDGHAVQIADVRVGEITRISLTDDFRAEVTMEVDDSREIPKDSQALLRTTSLLGEKFIELRPNGDPLTGPFLAEGDVIEDAGESPELEFVAEQAVRVLGGVVSTDLATLVETGAVGFGDRGDELAKLIDDVSVISATLADRTGAITSIIDGLGGAAATLDEGRAELDELLVNLADTTDVLVDNRERAVVALEELTRLARIQNEEVFGPHLADLDRQLDEVDAVLVEVVSATAEVDALLGWLAQFATEIPRAVPNEFAQVYGWFVTPDQDAG